MSKKFGYAVQCAKCGSPDTKSIGKREYKNAPPKRRFLCHSCGNKWLQEIDEKIDTAAPQKRLDSADEILKKSAEETKKVLSCFKEFKNLPTDTIESRLIAKAILDMESPFSSAALRNSARTFISEKAKEYGVVEEGVIDIEFIDPTIRAEFENDEEFAGKTDSDEVATRDN
jgi:hypothetical protein